MNEQQAVQEFLGDRPGVSQLAEWRITLERRVQALERDVERSSAGEAVSLQLRIASLRKQIHALYEEEAVTRFVEDSVRVTMAMGAVVDELGPMEVADAEG